MTRSQFADVLVMDGRLVSEHTQTMMCESEQMEKKDPAREAALKLLKQIPHILEAKEQKAKTPVFDGSLASDSEIVTRIETVLEEAQRIFKEEDRVCQVPQPCHIFGDIHGNFIDLKYYEALLWPLGVAFSAGSFLWLGDYVDRGVSSVETLLYMMCMKVRSSSLLLVSVLFLCFGIDALPLPRSYTPPSGCSFAAITKPEA